MSNIKERLIGAITVMDESNAQRLWNVVERLYSSNGWDAVEEVEPDEMDLQMIQEAQENPDCKSIASIDEVNALFS